jgi:hypothetical protein
MIPAGYEKSRNIQYIDSDEYDDDLDEFDFGDSTKIPSKIVFRIFLIVLFLILLNMKLKIFTPTYQ